MTKFYIYKMTHVPSGRTYIGQRKLPKKYICPYNDKYFGSGVRWIPIYKKHNGECTKEILAVTFAQEIVDKLEIYFIAREREINGELCVNIADGGNRPPKRQKLTAEEKKQRKAESSHRWYVNNKERAKMNSDKWKKNNPERAKENKRRGDEKYYSKSENKEKRKEQRRIWRSNPENRKKVNRYALDYYYKHKAVSEEKPKN